MLDRKHVGRSYGPFLYEAGAEKMREFAFAIAGDVPSPVYTDTPADVLPRDYWDRDFAKARHGSLVAPPTFCVNFAMKPFFAAITDREVGVDFLLLVHGEQEFEFLRPVRPGDVLSTTGVIADICEKNEKDFLVVRTTTVDAAGREVVKAVWTAVIRRA